jgi:SAM-dependent methyltransferase
VTRIELTGVRCPLCRGDRSARLLTPRAARSATVAMESFWARRRRRHGSPAEHVTHGVPAEVRRCRDCGSLWRASFPERVEHTYAQDLYAPDEVEHLWARAWREYEADADWLLAQGLTPRARILEVGCFTGAFLAFAELAGAQATGIDVSPQLVAIARRRGLDARAGTFDPRDHDPGSYDAVWILNCFEQLADLDATIDGVRWVLAAGGRLVLRTPNARFVTAAHRRWSGAMLRRLAHTNHVSGVPFAHCLTAPALSRLLRRHGFGEIDVRGREFTTRDAPELEALWRATRPLRRAALATMPSRAPWLDVTARR